MKQAKLTRKTNTKTETNRNAKTAKPKSSIRSSRYYKEVRFIIVLAIAIFLMVSLITYHATDPCWSHVGSTKSVANMGGIVGAWIADILLYVFGFAAYVFPIMLVYATALPLAHKTEQSNKLLTFMRTIGFLLILGTVCGLSSLYFVVEYLPVGPGGVLGNLIHQSMLKSFHPFGSGVIMFGLLLAGITMFTGLSWLKVIDILGRITVAIFSSIGWLFGKIVRSSDEPYKEEQLIQIPKPEPKLAIKSKPKPQITEPKLEQTVKIAPEPKYPGTRPPLDLLDLPDENSQNGYTREQLEAMSKEVELKLQDFGIEARVVAVHPGPVITRFELDLAAGTKASKITNIAKDLARSLSVTSVRVVEVIPGKSVVGLELPNADREVVRLREILASKQYRHSHAPLALALGKDISGSPVVVDLAKMPHLLIAGTTGSGKSVGVNAILLSLLYKYSPKEVRLIMIDPKMLELSVYEGIPHLLTPVVTDMKDAANALRWCVAEMDRRYKLMASLGVRNIMGYNGKIKDAKQQGAPLLDPLHQSDSGEEPEELRELPSIVVIADEFADLIMVVGKKIEELIARIAQKARAAGIHLILATQRPSVDVITGLIKANIPSRIGFQVSSRIDSRTILDQMGAEQLLGYGDMLYLPPGTVIPVRVHGAFVADDEVHRVVKFLRKQGKPEYINEILEGPSEAIPGIDAGTMSNADDAEQDQFYDQAVEFVVQAHRVSISSIQRRFKIGYNRAARIVEAMEAAGVVSQMEANGNRTVLVPNRNQE